MNLAQSLAPALWGIRWLPALVEPRGVWMGLLRLHYTPVVEQG